MKSGTVLHLNGKLINELIIGRLSLTIASGCQWLRAVSLSLSHGWGRWPTYIYYLEYCPFAPETAQPSSESPVRIVRILVSYYTFST